MATAMGGIGAGINAVSGIGSSINSKQQGKRAARQMEQQQETLNQLLLGDGEGNQGFLGMAQQGMQDAIGDLGGITERGAGQLGDLAQQLQGINPQYEFSNFDFTDAPEIGGHAVGAAPDVGGYNFQNVDTGQSYDFAPGQQTMDQAMDAFRTEAAGTRANALDQMASQSRADMAGLDAMLASRGVGRGSGVATGALSDLAGQQGQQMAGLERDLATLGSQTALQGAQFDVERQLQQDQLGSQYNLGERGLLTDTALQQQSLQSQYGLGADQLRSQNWGTAEQLAAQLGMAQDQLASQNWATDQQMRSDYDMGMQQLASQYGLSQAQLQQQGLGMAGDMIGRGMDAQVQAGLGMGNMFSGMMGPALNAMLGSIGMTAEGVAAAGRGAGANPAGASLIDFAKNYMPQGMSGAQFMQQNAGYNPYNASIGNRGGNPLMGAAVMPGGGFSVGNVLRR